MKKIMISLLMVAATLNAMAITYSGKVKVRLTSSDNQYCEAVVATSDELNDGLNNSYYAPFNDENKEVHLYVEYGGTRYAHFGSSAATMTNMPLIMKANLATSYTFTFSDMVGTIEIYDKVAGANIDKSQPYDFTIEASERDANNIVANRFVINYDPSVLVSLTTNEEGWASFAYSANVVPVDNSLKMYKGAINGEVLSLTEVGYVKAGEGVIVKGNANTTYDFMHGTAYANYNSNDLIGCPVATPVLAGTNFVLSYKNGATAFYEYTGSEIPAHKAYLNFPASTPAPQRIRMVINGTTAVDNVEAESVKAEKFVENGQIYIRRGNEVYNLQGQIVK